MLHKGKDLLLKLFQGKLYKWFYTANLLKGKMPLFFKRNQWVLANFYLIYFKIRKVCTVLYGKIVTQQESDNLKLNIEYHNVVYRNLRLPNIYQYNLVTVKAVRYYSSYSVGDGGPIISESDTVGKGQFKLSHPIVNNTCNKALIIDFDEKRFAIEKDKLSLLHIYKNLFIPKIYKDAYKKMKIKYNSIEPGLVNEEFSIDTINKIILEMKNRSFKFKPSKRILITKLNGGRSFLGIPSIVDKVVLLAIKSLIEGVYEPIFKDSNHGFRPNRGCHTTLKTIKE